MPEKKHFKILSKRKLFDFMSLEDGSVSQKKAISTGAVIGASMLGSLLFGAVQESAGTWYIEGGVLKHSSQVILNVHYSCL